MAAAKTGGCESTGSATEFVPRTRSLPVLRKASQECRGCELYCRATQAVFGEGPKNAPIMLIGEQPGDQEDQQGHPFVGPAGRLLDESLVAAGIAREDVFVTNAVKHFKWEARGKRRLHSKPSAREIRACRPWLDAEIRVVRPHVICCLGATAAQALLGRAFRVSTQRGALIETSPLAPIVTATVHPSSILRARSDDERHAALAQFVDDLRTVRAALEAAV